jgi:hypothetical protein
MVLGKNKVKAIESGIRQTEFPFEKGDRCGVWTTFNASLLNYNLLESRAREGDSPV